MRVFLIIVILFSGGKAFTQKIPLDTLLSFSYKNVSIAENFLLSSGYEFRNKQLHPGLEIVTIYWDHKVKDAHHFAYLTVDTVRNISTTINYEFYTKEEFIEIMTTIRQLKFDDSVPLIYEGNVTYKEFLRKDVNILLSSSKDSYNELHYSLTICKCTWTK